MKIKLTGEFATLTGRQEVEIYGPTNIKQLLKALDNSYPNMVGIIVTWLLMVRCILMHGFNQ